MSYDLVLKNTKTSWARGLSSLPSVTSTAPMKLPSLTATTSKAPSLAELRCTSEEKAKLAKIASVKAAAQKGDKNAQKQWKNLLAVGIPALRTKAATGDLKAKRDLQCLRASKLFAPGVALMGGKKAFIGAYPAQIMGGSLNDDELAVARDSGSSERGALARVRGDFIGQYPYQRTRLSGTRHYQINLHRNEGRKGRKGRKGRVHQLKKIVKQAAQGDTNALTKLQRVQQRLSQRAARDPRAGALLQKINQWYSTYQAQYQGAASTPYQQPYQQPYSQTTPGDLEQELAITDPEL